MAQSGALSDYAEKAILERITGRNVTWDPAVSYLYAALCTAAVTDASTGATITEPTAAEYNDYARIQVLAASLADASSPGGTLASAADITFADLATDDTGCTVVAVALLDSVTEGAGNMIWFDGTIASKDLSTTNTPPVIKSGSLTFTLG